MGASTGIITGIPTTLGNGPFVFNATVQDATGATSAPQSFVISIAPTLQILTPELPSGEVGTFYINHITVTGGVPPYVSSLVSGALPAGLVLTINEFVNGTPTTLGTSVFTARVTDAASFSVTQTFTVNVIAGGLAITTSSLPTGIAGTPYQQQLAASGGGPPYVWSIESGALPTGLMLSSAGTITGTSIISGSFFVQVQITDSASYTANKGLVLTILPALTITSAIALPLGVVGTPYSDSLSVSGGTPPYAWSVVRGTISPGLTLTSSGTITGVPTVAGGYVFVVQVGQGFSASLTATQSFSVSIVPQQLTILTATLPSGMVGTPYLQSLLANGGTPPYSWSVTSGSLPSGLSLASTGAFRYAHSCWDSDFHRSNSGRGFIECDADFELGYHPTDLHLRPRPRRTSLPVHGWVRFD